MTDAPNPAGGESQAFASAASPALPQDAIIVVPVRETILFPGLVLPLTFGREKSVRAVQEAVRAGRAVGLLLQQDPTAADPAPDGLYRTGTLANVLRYVTAADGSHHAICQGEARFRVVEFLSGYPFHAARFERIAESVVMTPEIEARMHRLKTDAAEALRLIPQIPPELASALEGISSPSALADAVASFLDIPAPEKQTVLETLDVQARLDLVLRRLTERLAVLRLSQQIGERTKESLDQQQREHFLREQLKTIQSALGEGDTKTAEIEELRKAIAAAKMPAEVEQQAEKEVGRLARMPEAAAEYAMIRTYIDWLVELPWSTLTEDAIDLARARAILDEDHYGLAKVKRRILEYLAVRKLKPEGKSPILCLVGPPGVGKTSLGQSIARATGRKFIRISLGGIHDEAEIRGHRRTYIGALPGNIIQAIRKAGTRNPVFMLDELDKVGAGGFHGDPASALLEVLDPEQNFAFRDNYLAVPFDLSRVMFIGTANVLDTIPGPLRDRLEIIELSGYTPEEKLQIARRYLIRRQLEANGLSAEQCEITDEALRAIIRDYTREAGCRNLEREIGTVFRHVAARIVDGSAERVRIEATDLEEILGPARFESEVATRTAIPGVATGLAWTPTGGDILFIEATHMPGSGRLILTGQLGNVMKESARAALSLVKSNAEELGIAVELVRTRDIHIHVPAGAVPKDGPSAGVAIYIALVSLLTGRTVRPDVAMTGEISLRGLVLPVGGIKEKVVAAARAGITTVLLPARNRRDFADIPDEARKLLRFVWVERVSDAVEAALEGEPSQGGRVDEARAAGS
jgi:ATP-dependent Lon protease